MNPLSPNFEALYAAPVVNGFSFTQFGLVSIRNLHFSDEDIEAAKSAIDGLKERSRALGPADVGGAAEDLALSAQLCGGAIDRFLGLSAEGHHRALLEEAFDNGTSDAARAAGHGGEFSGNRFHIGDSTEKWAGCDS